MTRLTRLMLLIVFLFPSVILFCPPAMGGEVTLPGSILAEGKNLVLNGQGYRTKFIIKVYAAGLYLPQRATDARAVIELDEPMAIRMRFVYREVSAEDLVNAWNEGFANSGYPLSPLKGRIEKFNSLFTIPARTGDVYDFIYTPGRGTHVTCGNGTEALIEGLDFKKALFSIWLGDKPADSGLKEAMLGK